MKTLRQLVIETKCRKGTAKGTTKRGAYWLACEPIIIRDYGEDGIGQHSPDITNYLELRHYRSGEVHATIHRDAYHENGSDSGSGDSWHGCAAVLDCATVEDVIVCLKGTEIDDCVAFGGGAKLDELRRLGLPDSAPAPDENGK